MKDSSSTGKGELHSLAGLVVLWGYHSRDCGRLAVRSGDFKRFLLGGRLQAVFIVLCY